MKTIVETATGLSKYLLEDDAVVTMFPNRVEVDSSIPNVIFDLSEDTATLYEGVTDVPSDWAGNVYIYDGTTWDTVEAVEAAQRRAIMACTPRQARLALSSAGLYEAVQTSVAAVGDQARIEWEYANTVERTSPVIAELQEGLGLTDEDLDNLFALAVTL